MSDIVIRAKGLTKIYRIGGRTGYSYRLTDIFTSFGRGRAQAFHALTDVSFDIRQGEIVGLIGGNGAGKSTLLKILSRVVRPSAGMAEIKGRLASLLEVGTGFHPELTGRENIYMSGIILGMTRSEVTRRFEEIVAFSGAESFIDTPIKRYSSGMQARLGFAVAAHLESEIMLVDEVLAVGDAEFQKKCLGKIKDVATGGRTVLFVSHNMNSIQSLCTSAMWLENGRLRSCGTDVRHVTVEYLTSGKGIAKAEWISGTRHGDGRVMPLALRLLLPSGDIVAAPVSNDIDLTLEVDLDVQEFNSSLQLGYILYTEDGEILWWSYQTDAAPSEWPPLRKGRMRLATTLPKRLLNEGRYRIEFVCCLYNQEWLYRPGGNAAYLDFEIQGGLSDSPLWTSARNGTLAPILPWRCVGASSPAAPRKHVDAD